MHSDAAPPSQRLTLRTHDEIARIMTERGFKMCRGRVWQIEQSALKKMARHPFVLQLAQEFGIDVETELGETGEA